MKFLGTFLAGWGGLMLVSYAVTGAFHLWLLTQTPAAGSAEARLLETTGPGFYAVGLAVGVGLVFGGLRLRRF